MFSWTFETAETSGLAQLSNTCLCPKSLRGKHSVTPNGKGRDVAACFL